MTPYTNLGVHAGTEYTVAVAINTLAVAASPGPPPTAQQRKQSQMCQIGETVHTVGRILGYLLWARSRLSGDCLRGNIWVCETYWILESRFVCCPC